MKSLTSFPRILIFPRHVDFRKGRKSLAAFVQTATQEHLFSPTLFVFINRRRDGIKALYWERTGFALWEKGLEEARFPWPKPPFPDTLEISSQQAEWLLEGIDIWKLKPHEELHYSSVV